MTSESKKKILFVLPIIGEPRFPKRMSMLNKCGYDVGAVAYDREYYKNGNEVYNVEIIGRLENGKYFKRIASLIKSIPTLHRKIKEAKIVYTFGPDIALVTRIASLGMNKPIFLEIADIREIQTNKGLSGVLYRVLDRYIVTKCSLLVVTAVGYSKEYYKKWLKCNVETLVIENKILKEEYRRYEKDCIAPKISNEKIKSRIKIGYYGLLRCKKSLQVLDLLAKKGADTFEIIIAGYPSGVENDLKRIEKNKNVNYRGIYKSPDDLCELYMGVDIVWACYPFPGPDDYNWRWARTNRFYESCYYKKPMIALAGSGDSQDVKEYDVGCIINNEDVNSIVKSLLDIKVSDVIRWTNNTSTIPEDVYVYAEEGGKLKDAIEKQIIKTYNK